jgi:hypothetical protein
MQRHATQQLDVKMAHLHDTLGALTHHGEGFRQHGHPGSPWCQALSELFGFGTKRVIRQLFKFQLPVH